MHGTRLFDAGKPKVVTISRPSSLRTRLNSDDNIDTVDRPTTPLDSGLEVSAFSPDTPADHGKTSRRYSIAPYHTSLSSTVVSTISKRLASDDCATEDECLLDKVYKVHNSRAESSWLHCQGDCEILQALSFAENRGSMDELEPLEVDSAESCSAHPPLSTHALAEASRTASPDMLATTYPKAWSPYRPYEDTLDVVTSAFDAYPHDLLCLDSPAIRRLRKPNSMDELHIDGLHRIFPHTASRVLSALAALLIVDSYLSTIEICANEWQSDSYEQSLNQKAQLVAIYLDVQAQQLMKAICGEFNELTWRALKALAETIESTCR